MEIPEFWQSGTNGIATNCCAAIVEYRTRNVEGRTIHDLRDFLHHSTFCGPTCIRLQLYSFPRTFDDLRDWQQYIVFESRRGHTSTDGEESAYKDAWKEQST